MVVVGERAVAKSKDLRNRLFVGFLFLFRLSFELVGISESDCKISLAFL